MMRKKKKTLLESQERKHEKDNALNSKELTSWVDIKYQAENSII